MEQDNIIEVELIEEFNLPKYIKGKSFSGASIAIDNKFKDRKDKMAEQTKEDLLERLAEAQEYVKMQEQMQEEAMQANQEEVPDMMDGEIPEGMEEFAQQGMDPSMQGGQPDMGGGEMDPAMMEEMMAQQGGGGGMPQDPNMFNLGGFLSNKDNLGGVIGGAGFLTDTLGGLTGDQGIDESGVSGGYGGMSSGDAAMGALGGAMQGASAGMALGPLGAAGGALVGGIGSLIGSGRKKRSMSRANRNASYIENNQFSNDFALGGPMNKAGYKDPLEGYRPNLVGAQGSMNPLGVNPLSINKPTLPSANDYASNIPAGMNVTQGQRGEGKTSGTIGNWIKDNAFEVARTAPIVGNLLNRPNSPNTARGNRLDNRYESTPYDVNAATNQLQRGNVSRALTESSGGNLGQLRASQLGSAINMNRGISDAYAQADAINRQENQAQQQFNAGIDQANVQLDNQYLDRKAKDEGAYNTAKSARTSALYEDIGELGRELSDKKNIANTLGYKWNGKYNAYVNDSGDTLSKSELMRLQKEADDKKEASKQKIVNLKTGGPLGKYKQYINSINNAKGTEDYISSLPGMSKKRN